MTTGNVYESGAQLDQESERLRTFDLPTQVSIQAIGNEFGSEDVLLDIGSGENPSLASFAKSESLHYAALDIRRPALLALRGAVTTTPAVEANARTLPVGAQTVNIAHARFVAAHLPLSERRALIADTFDTVAPGGKAIFIDYDWTKLHGSNAVNALRDFTITHIDKFDAAYGTYSQAFTKATLGEAADIEEQRTTSPHLSDYGPMLGLRPITLGALKLTNAPDALIMQATDIFDDLEAEAASPDAPGLYMPDMVAIIAHKSL